MGEENSGEIEWNSFQESYGRYHGRTDAFGVGREGKGQIYCWRFLKSSLLKLVCILPQDLIAQSEFSDVFITVNRTIWKNKL